jgi:hypothetical protein
MKSWLSQKLHRLPLFRQVDALVHAAHIANLVRVNQFFQQRLLLSPKYRDPRKLNHYELQTFSQNGEDGIIAEIFKRIGTRSRLFVEFGVGDGLENNTVFLLACGWQGWWMEGDERQVEVIRRQLHRHLASKQLRLRRELVTRENVEALLSELEVPIEFDLLSLDVDRNTSHVWRAMKKFRPRAVVVEYNASIPPSVDWEVEYSARQGWNYSVYFGAGLKTMEEVGKESGYSLVGCDLSGTNAFFVRDDQDLELFAPPFTAENHHEPPRYWSARREGHRRCLTDL